MRRSRDAQVAFASVVILLVTAAGEASLGLRADASDVAPVGPLSALLEGNVLTLRSDDPAALRALDPATLALVVAGGAAMSPVAVDDRGAEGMRVVYLAGAGSEDEALLVRADGGPAPAVRVATANDMLPGERWGAAVATEGRVAYVFGGALSPSGLAGQPIGEWVAHDAIVRVDLATGSARTMLARFPLGIVAASAVWDPRPSEVCPGGCAYVFGGIADHVEPQDAIYRYDPVSDVLTTLDVKLPGARFDVGAAWTGTHAILLGGAFNPLRFDPVARTVESLPANPLAFVFGGRTIFDPRATPVCPEGCVYLLGGRHAADFAQPLTSAITQQDGVLRLDPSTGLVVPTPSRLPHRVEAASVAWDGARAYVLGGRTCTIDACVRSDAVMSFDPADGTTTTLASMEDPPEDAPALWYEGSVVIVGGKAEGTDVGSTARIARHSPQE